MAKKETRPEDTLRDLVAGRRTEIPAEGIPGVEIVYQSGPVRVHRAWTSGRVELTAEREVLVDVELVEAAGVAIQRVRFGWGPRSWRFRGPADPPPKRKATPPPAPRLVGPGERPKVRGNPFDTFQGRAET